MKLYKGGGKAYFSIFIGIVCLLLVSNPIGAVEDSIDSPSTREAPDSASDSTAGAATASEVASDSAGASGSAGSAGTGVSSSAIDTLEFTGAAMARVPIVVPPGRSGIQPNLNLTYNSYQKNGWLGVGWSLDVGSIQRSARYGVDYSANDFVAVKEGSFSELVERGDWGPGFYGAKIEGGFARYRYNGQDGWEVTAKDGTQYFYGTTEASRQDDPADSSRVFKWCLDRVQDPNGNTMTVDYVKDQGQIYLDEILYTANGNLDPANTVRFYLEERDDAPAVYTPYFAVRTAYRLRTIEVLAHEEPVRAYELTYDADPQTDGLQYSNSTGRSLLYSVQQYGSDARVDSLTGEVSNGSALPALVMGTIQWPDSAFTFGGSQVVSGYKPKKRQLVPMDFSGDGRTDFIIRHDGGTLARYVSDGDAFVYNGYQKVSGYGSDNQLVVLDINGDGLMDFIIRHDGGTLVRYVSDGEKFVYIGYQKVAGYNGESELVPLDLNGDGRGDFIIRHDGGTLQRFVSDGEQFISNGSQKVAGYNGESQLVPLDINGDGRGDFIIRHDGGTLARYVSDGEAFVYNGYQKVAGYNGESELVPLDINGDGRGDFIIRHDGGTLQRYVSDGRKFKSIGSQKVAGYNGESQLVPLDLNGDGLGDFIIRHDGGTLARYVSDGEAFVYVGYQKVAGYNGESELVAMDIDGNGNREFIIRHDGGTLQRYFAFEQKADLLSSITNGLGATTRIEYTASSEFKNERLPMMVHPVSKITIDDGLGNQSVTEMSYAGGLYDPVTREFRGFKTVIRTHAVDTPHATVTETKFHQDQWLKGRQYEVELREPGENGALLSESTFTWDKQFLDPPQDSAAFVKLQQKHSESYEGVTIFTRENYTYDDTSGNLLSKTVSGTDGENVTVNYVYANLADWMWRKTRETLLGSVSGKVRQTDYTYFDDGTGNLRFKEFWLDGQVNPKIVMTYDSYGNQQTVTDPRGNTTTTEYDDATHTYPVRITYPQTSGVDHVVENEAWDYRFGKVAITKDENDNRTYYHYDAFGRPVQVDAPNGGQVITEYNDDQFPRYVVTRAKEDAAGSSIDAYQYVDGLGREIQTITFGEGGKSIVTKKFYDALGRNDLVEGPFFAVGTDYPLNPAGAYPWQQTSFDLRGRPEAIESAAGEYGSVVAFFDYSGLSTTVTDPDGGSKTERKDYLGRVTRVIEHGDQAGYTTDYTYNVAGDLLAVKDDDENETKIKYDTLGRKINMNDPDMGYWEYTYDANGNLLTQLDEKLQTVTFAYDKLNRAISKTYSTSDSTVTYTYDNLTIPNGRGRLYAVTNAHSTTTYNGYDKMGNATGVSKTITGDSNIYITRYEYDLSGKVTRTIYPDDYAVSNTYFPGSGLLQTVSGSDGVEYARLSGYAPTGKIGSIEHANGVYTSYTYDPESTRLSAIVTTRSGPTPDLQNKQYQYTAAGDIQRISDAVNNIDYDYTYDKLHRLTAETNTGAFEPVSYAYNAIGNITSKTVGGTTLTYTYDELHKHAVKSIAFNGQAHTYRYDENGNMIEAPDFSNAQQVATRSITYNADNMPVRIHYENGRSQAAEAPAVVAQNDAVSNSSSTETSTSSSFRVACWINTVAGTGDAAWTVDFYYDGDGVRVKKHVLGGSQTYYIGAHYEVKDGVATRYIFAGNLRVAMIKDASVNYFHKDHLGSSTVMTDANGQQVESTDYMPFGATRDHSGPQASNYKFTDQEFDPETGLYNYNARLYDPLIGRFISPDSIVQAPFDPQTLNRYSYARNNPLIYADPSGHDFGLSILIGAVIGAAIGGASAAISDGDVLEGMLIGAITGAFTAGIFHGAGAIIEAGIWTDPLTGMTLQTLSSAEQAVIHAGAGAFSGGINSGIAGGDVGIGILAGGISGGISKYFGGFIPENFTAQLAGRSIVGGLTGGVAAELYGESFGIGFAHGSAIAAAGYLFNDLHLRIRERILFSEQRTWLDRSKARCRYRVEQRDFVQEELQIRQGGKFKTLVSLDKGHYTKWYVLNHFSKRPISRTMFSGGMEIRCPPAGPNFKGPVPNFFP